jgi:dCMP deaminase
MTVPIITPTDWDVYYMGFADHAKTKSKDPSTKVGAVIVDNDGNIISTGFNGFPRGVNDLEERYADRNIKILMAEHAERNAIFSAARKGNSLKGCVMYLSGLPPCSDCARAIIQSGICRLVVRSADMPERWKETCETALLMLDEAGVSLQSFS